MKKNQLSSTYFFFLTHKCTEERLHHTFCPYSKVLILDSSIKSIITNSPIYF